MTGQGPRKVVDAGHSPARLLQARDFHESDRSLVTLAQSKSCNSAIAQARLQAAPAVSPPSTRPQPAARPMPW